MAGLGDHPLVGQLVSDVGGDSAAWFADLLSTVASESVQRELHFDSTDLVVDFVGGWAEIRDAIADDKPLRVDLAWLRSVVAASGPGGPVAIARTPSRMAVRAVLDRLVTGACNREEASAWATPWVTDTIEFDLTDTAAWDAITAIAGADVPGMPDRRYLFGRTDFEAWRDELDAAP